MIAMYYNGYDEIYKLGKLQSLATFIKKARTEYGTEKVSNYENECETVISATIVKCNEVVKESTCI